MGVSVEKSGGFGWERRELVGDDGWMACGSGAVYGGVVDGTKLDKGLYALRNPSSIWWP